MAALPRDRARGALAPPQGDPGKLDVTVVSVALPTMQRDLHASLADLQSVVNASTLALAVLLVTAGRLTDRIGARPVLAAGMAGPGVTNPFAASPAFPLIQRIAHLAFMEGFKAVLWTGAALLALGFVATRFVRRRDNGGAVPQGG